MPKEKKSTALDSFEDGLVNLKDISVWREDAKKFHLKQKLEEKEQDEGIDKEEEGDIIQENAKTADKEIQSGGGDAKPKDSPAEHADDDDEEVSDPQNTNLSDKVSLYRGDITKLKIDAIVNAANKSLLGGGGVDGCIHRAAGPKLLSACRQLNGCNTGEAKITPGFDLPTKHVIHTVGPIAKGNCDERLKRQLKSCYDSSLKLLETQDLKSIAFPCISTGIYGFPQDDAAEIAVSTIKEWLFEKRAPVDRIIFCVFLESDHKIYKEKMLQHFPIDEEDLNLQTPPAKKYKNKDLLEKGDDKSKASAEENLDAKTESSPKQREDVMESPLPSESHSDESKSADVCMDSQVDDTPVDSEMHSQPEPQVSEIEMGSSQEEPAGSQKMSDGDENSQTQETEK
ncbi:ADP-ribose glycohydrolase MACROD2 isoform X2 [Callorhinchus milii]|uniref:ADP-ribose glycohydrolase MACROD2 isoform X2 n=1 Tax=Callorhinchus milii TaxID=7868 RepID=UPI001C3FD1B0|nr:ADP-ribose glycohydrolase MACROD2 isoform X2 [Callorhinchus milii]